MDASGSARVEENFIRYFTMGVKIKVWRGGPGSGVSSRV